MSIATASPYSRGNKRFFEEQEGAPEAAERHSTHIKRVRLQRSPPVGRCGLQAPGYAIPQATLTALLGLFPDMDEKTVTDVLAECGSDIDAAIKRLTDLRLSSNDVVAAAAAEGSEPQNAPGHPGVHSDAPQTAGPQTADQWIDYLVSEMASAKDMGDARTRAATVLKNFESFMKAQVKTEGSNPEAAELARQNAVLKRAVQIQAQRLQDKAEVDNEVSRLRHMLAQYQEQLRALELNNYSLTLHLQKATANGGAMPHPRNPDVF